ncbi:hypothetical protein Poly51_10350 [Rubripirellula tenax]|uniref:Cytochrome C n=1 Tax=Rubripirellula tenax TaxID=2528015 RepID=A0A5C6FLR1_9BACT|nr:hypothetical protein [Rubripirellula tenax]TWU60754.1 hypothetical protein Poly51_10350 [Rubripirellula tenax]
MKTSSAWFGWLLVAGCHVVTLSTAVGVVRADDSVSPSVTPLSIATLPNAYRVSDRVISGGVPDGDAGLAALVDLGVRTIISVDGARPDVESADRHGLRYIHLPHGYDGIRSTRAKELAKAILELPTPIYIHCHHGKHRSPAAAAVACITSGRMTPDDGIELLRIAGTGAEYVGLYQAVERAQAVDVDELKSIQTDFLPQAPVPPLTTWMVELEQTFDQLATLVKSGDREQSIPQAVLLREHFTELLRGEHGNDAAQEFRKRFARSLEKSNELESAIRSGSPDSPAILSQIKSECMSCHQAHRDAS